MHHGQHSVRATRHQVTCRIRPVAGHEPLGPAMDTQQVAVEKYLVMFERERTEERPGIQVPRLLFPSPGWWRVAGWLVMACNWHPVSRTDSACWQNPSKLRH